MVRGRRIVGLVVAGTGGALAYVAGGGTSTHPEPAMAPARTVEITASRYRFEPSSIEVKPGERVMLVVRSADTDHGIAIKGLGIKAKVPRSGTPVSIELVANKVGTYAVSCSEYCGGGHSKMKAQLVVSGDAQ